MSYEPLFRELNTTQQLVLKDKVVCSCKQPFNGELILKFDGTFSCIGYVIYFSNNIYFPFSIIRGVNFCVYSLNTFAFFNHIMRTSISSVFSSNSLTFLNPLCLA